MAAIEVFAEVSCPFTHVGLNRLVANRAQRGLDGPLVHVRAWPLELVNGEPLAPDKVGPEVEVLRREVAPDLFAGFDPDALPRSTLPVLASTVAAYRLGLDVGERFALAVRRALFDEGRPVGEDSVLAALRAEHGIPDPDDADAQAVAASHEEGRRRGVEGSPHFFAGDEGFFCPGLDLAHGDGGLSVSFDAAGFERFTALAFA